MLRYVTLSIISKTTGEGEEHIQAAAASLIIINQVRRLDM